MMDVEMEEQEVAVIAHVQGRKLRSSRKNLPSRLSSKYPTSVGLDTLSDTAYARDPRRTTTSPPARLAFKDCTELLSSRSSVSPPPSATRTHKSRRVSRIPSELPIHRTQTGEHMPRVIHKHFEEPRLMPFDIPIILEQVISWLDESNTIPSEPAPIRRKPMSYQHALLIYYPDIARAMEVWAATCRTYTYKTNSEEHHSGVYACLLVNRDWNEAAKRVLRQKAFFANYRHWRLFSTRKSGHTPHLKTLVLHKVQQARNEELELLGLQPRLEWLELHVCPNLLPSENLLSSPFLKRIALPGCLNVDDATLETIARHCPNLEVLDLRACELVTDKGLVAIAEGCPKLKYLNVGRVKNGERITCVGVDAIARLTEVDTLGLAGCAVSDRGLWTIATYRGPKIERLSLNNCINLSNASIPLILSSTPNLQVLELRGCLRITHVRPIVEFRRKWQARGVLIEGCEVFEGRMRRDEEELEREERGENDELGWAEPMALDE